jgi:hypothetical protein
MKKVALISTYCDTYEKINVLSENIEILKNLGLDVFVISPIILPESVIKKCDYVFFTKENPVLVWPERAFTFWKTIYHQGKFVMMHRNVADYGWAALNQIKRLSEIALKHEYDIFYHLIYDVEISEVIIDEIKTNDVNFIHPRINPRIDPNNADEFWEATLHFMAFDKKTMSDVLNLITFENYSNGNGFAEGQALMWTEKLPINIKKDPIRDKIYYWENHDFFNYSKNENYKLFISKHTDCETIRENNSIVEMIDSRLRIFFYDVKEPKNIKIICDNVEYEHFIENTGFVVLGNDSLNVKSLCIDGDDYSEIFKNIIRNITYID